MPNEAITPAYNICSVPENSEQGASVLTLLVRDTVLVSLLIATPLMLDVWLLDFSTWLGVLSAVVAFPAGLKANGLFHEWGHLIGVRMFNRHPPHEQISSVVSDVSLRHETKQPSTVYGYEHRGTITEWLLPVILLVAIGTETLGQTALITGAFSAAIFGILVEGPIIRDAIARGDGTATWNDYLTHRDASIGAQNELVSP